MKTLVIVPTDPIEQYEAAGYRHLDTYFNPRRLFDRVIALSPHETRTYSGFGLEVRNVGWSRFAHELRHIRPDVVRAYGGYWPADLACSQRVEGIPIVVSLHDNTANSVSRSVQLADRVLCVSKAVLELARRRGVPADRLQLFSNRVDLDIHRPVTDPSRLASLTTRFGKGIHVLHVGRRTEQKNLDTLLQALARLPTSYRGIFVGRGDPRPYESLAAHLNIAHRCHWIDSVPNDELPAWYSWCDCMCTPSRHEGFGVVFIEAAACGAAIITSDIPPMNEYLRHDATACLVKEFNDPRALADSIQRVCEDTTYRDRLRWAAPQAAIPFDRHRVETTEADIYRAVMEAGPHRLTLRERGQQVSEAVGLVLRHGPGATVRQATRACHRAVTQRSPAGFDPAFSLFYRMETVRPGWLLRRHSRLARRQGIRGVRMALSVDCDTEEDVAALPGFLASLRAAGICPACAVPGVLLEQHVDLFRSLAADGFEFMNHGYAAHTALDPATGKTVSSGFYHERSLPWVRDDIQRGHVVCGTVLGHAPQGFRTPHFATFQRRRQLQVLYAILTRLGYRYSSSTIPYYGYRHGPIWHVGPGLVELPVTGWFDEPYLILDSYTCGAKHNGEGIERLFLAQLQKVAGRLFEQGSGVLNLYVDPATVAGWSGLVNMLAGMKAYATSFEALSFP